MATTAPDKSWQELTRAELVVFQNNMPHADHSTKQWRVTPHPKKRRRRGAAILQRPDLQLPLLHQALVLPMLWALLRQIVWHDVHWRKLLRLLEATSQSVCSREAYQSLGMVQEWCNTRDAHPQVHCWPGARAASFSAPFHTSGYCMQKGVQILSCTMHWLSTIFARWDRSLHSQSWHPNREHQHVFAWMSILFEWNLFVGRLVLISHVL